MNLLPLLSLLSPSASGADISVPGDYSTIGAAIAAATAGDTLLVDAGAYDEALTIDKSLTIIGAGSDTTSIYKDSTATSTHYAVVDLSGATTEVTLSGFSFSGEQSPHYRAFYVDEATLNLADVVVTSMTARADGGALACLTCTLTIEDSWFSGNAVSDDGGHLWLDDSNVEIRRTTFVDGAAGDDGGAIHYQVNNAAADVGLLVADDCTFTNNDADDGGAINAFRSSGAAWIAVDQSTFVDNDATESGSSGQGGALRVVDMELFVEDSSFTHNTSTESGGAIDTDDGFVSLYGSSFTGNSAVSSSAGYGGAVWIDDPPSGVASWGGPTEVISCQFTDNVARIGGGLAFDGLDSGPAPDLLVDGTSHLEGDSLFAGNQAELGGGIYISDVGEVVVRDTVLTDNVATGTHGGAVRVYDGDQVWMYRDYLCHNTAGDTGGGLAVYDVSTFTYVFASAFVNNTATTTGGGVYVSGSSDLRIFNNTLVGNDAEAHGGGGIYLADSTPIEVWNNVVAWSTGDGLSIDDFSGVLSWYWNYNAWYSNTGTDKWNDETGEVIDSTAETSSLFVDPQLVDYDDDDDCDNDSLWPAFGSPLIDAGYTETGYADPDPDEDGTTASDIGAYGGEYADDTLHGDWDDDTFILMFDCDDGDDTTYPGADEWCDGDDHDCDGDVYEDDSVDTIDYHLDHDEDGYGDPGDSTTACPGYPPSGWVADATDCDDDDFDEKPGVWWYADDDDDGHGDSHDTPSECARTDPGDVTSDDDCDDDDGYTYGGADEICDGVVNSCSGDLLSNEVDDDGDHYVECPVHTSGWSGTAGVWGGEDCDDEDIDEYPGVTWYADADGDGQGDAGSTSSCARAAASDVLNDDDCDDEDIDVYLGADEYCDDVDNDCDDEVDEDDALDAPVWYLDSDEDGHGDPADQASSCDQPSGYAAAGGDCDDARGDVYPGATEVWYDGTDQDCDGHSDFDQDFDSHDKQGLGGDDCDDTDAAVYPGASEVFDDGVDQDCDGVDWSDEASTRQWEGGRDGQDLPAGCGCTHRGGRSAPLTLFLVLVAVVGRRCRRGSRARDSQRAGA